MCMGADSSKSDGKMSEAHDAMMKTTRYYHKIIQSVLSDGQSREILRQSLICWLLIR